MDAKNIPRLCKICPKFHEFDGEGVLVICHVVSFDVVELVDERHPEHEDQVFCVSRPEPWGGWIDVAILEDTPVN